MNFLLRLFAIVVVIAWAISRQFVVAQQVVSPIQERSETSEKILDDESNQKAKSEETLYVRVSKDENSKPRALQTATVRFVGAPGTKYQGRVVDLVGVVHIGQAEYYSDLNRKLSKYDRVLYELVAPDGTRFRPEDLEKRRSILSSVQSGMKDMLNLEYQLEKVDYMAENFRHADMSPKEFAEDFARRGDSLWKMGARMMGAGLATQAANGGDVGLLFALFSDDRAMYMKRTMAQQLVDLDSATAGMLDENGEDTLIQGRNAKAFNVLREVLSDKENKEIAVFYGAGHLSDMAKRLKENFKMVRKGTTWLDAWDLTRN